VEFVAAGDGLGVMPRDLLALAILYVAVIPSAGVALLIYSHKLATLSVDWGENLSTKHPNWRGFLMWNISAEKWMVIMPIFFRTMGAILMLIGAFAAAVVLGVVR
jgi:hypothetical protein